MQNDLVLFGIQGSGKGTMAKNLLMMSRPGEADKSGEISGKIFSYFETGGELRRLAASTTPLGKKIKSIIEAGHLVPNEVVMEMVESFINENAPSGKNIIFDGLPRNKEQSETFEALLKKHGRNYIGFYFELAREESEKRLLTRRICSKCKTVYPGFFVGEKCVTKLADGSTCEGPLVTRADDNAESIKTRIDIFFKETLPVINEWDTAGRIKKFDAAPSIPEVFEKVSQEIHKLP